ncbi:MAG TPA: glycosyltransferase family A protein [Gemmatimonadaceae bacterium]|nr:glycosyltransferase family A protein [Gemmatimonadaceae bacterium]
MPLPITAGMRDIRPVTFPSVLLAALVLLQGAAALLLIIRLLPGRTRRPPIAPLEGDAHAGRVTVVVTSLDEVHRIGPCLDGLRMQGPAMLEALIVDSRSTDGTWELIAAAAALDPRIVPMHDDPLPPEWVGKVWALEHGLRQARGEWVLGIDADTTPQPGLVAAAVDAADALGYDAVSFAPRFNEMTVAEQWLQPAMLTTLVYRFGAAGERAPAPDRVMANGQCFLARRSTLLANGGYSSARRSWCDDVTLARHMARNGARVGFLDGARIIGVRAYSGIGQMWREWGRSIDLKDGTTPLVQFADCCFVMLTQFLPLPAVLLALAFDIPAWRAGGAGMAWLTLNAALVMIRVLLTFGLAGSYAERHWTFWLSFTADPVAAIRIVLSSLKRPRQWRTRQYEAETVVA